MNTTRMKSSAARSLAAVLLALLAWVHPSAAQTTPRLDNPRRTPVVEVFETARDGVVNISARRLARTRLGLMGVDEEALEDIFDLPLSRRVPVQNLGSGFVIHPAGYVVTNEHVVRRAEQIVISLADGSELPAEVISADSACDLAVLKVELPVGQVLPALPLGRSDQLLIGETVIAIGNPLGYQHTVTAGVVSATDRELQLRRDVCFRGLIQTDASINPGNSGGPLLNVNAEVIGIATAIRADAQNIGFAIPIAALVDDLPQLLDFARLNRVEAGLAVHTVPEGGRPRVAVESVDPAGPAEKAGLQVGDIILAVDGHALRGPADYYVAMLDSEPDAPLELRVLRDGTELSETLTLRLAERPQPDGAALAQQWLGMTVEPITEEAVRRYRLRTDRGLLVRAVAPDGPAEVLGVEPGDVLLQLGSQRMSDLDQLGLALEDAQPGQQIRIGLVRGPYRVWAQIRTATAPAVTPPGAQPPPRE